VALNHELLARFWDDKSGGLFFTASGVEDLLVRRKESHDGALPSGNSVSMLNLLRLARLTGRFELETKAAELARALAGQVGQNPSAHTHLLLGLDLALGPSLEIVMTGRREADETVRLLNTLRQEFLPHLALIFKPGGDELTDSSGLAEFARDLPLPASGAAAYICQDQSCQLTISDEAGMRAFLSSLKGEPG